MIVYDSRMFYEGGNPLLRPSIRQSIDLNLTYSWLTFSAGFTREHDIFRTCRNKLTTYYAIGSTAQDIYNYTQQVGLTLSYSINATRSKYRGTGAGNDEKNRL